MAIANIKGSAYSKARASGGPMPGGVTGGYTPSGSQVGSGRGAGLSPGWAGAPGGAKTRNYYGSGAMPGFAEGYAGTGSGRGIAGPRPPKGSAGPVGLPPGGTQSKNSKAAREAARQPIEPPPMPPRGGWKDPAVPQAAPPAAPATPDYVDDFLAGLSTTAGSVLDTARGALGGGINSALKFGTGRDYIGNVKAGRESPAYGQLDWGGNQSGHAAAAEQTSRRFGPINAMLGGLGVEAAEYFMGNPEAGFTQDTLKDTIANAAGAIRPYSTSASDFLINYLQGP